MIRSVCSFDDPVVIANIFCRAVFCFFYRQQPSSKRGNHVPNWVRSSGTVCSINWRGPSTSHSFRLIAALACSLRLCGSVRIFIYIEISVNRSTRMFPEAFDEKHCSPRVLPGTLVALMCREISNMTIV